MSQDIINNRFFEESVFAIADGYCVINLTKSIVRGSMYQVVNGKKYNLNKLVYYEVFATKSEAMKREAQIKKLSRKQKLLFIINP